MPPRRDETTLSTSTTKREQDVATNRLPAAGRKRHDNSIINLEVGARSQAACGSTRTVRSKYDDQLANPPNCLHSIGGVCDRPFVFLRRASPDTVQGCRLTPGIREAGITDSTPGNTRILPSLCTPWRARVRAFTARSSRGFIGAILNVGRQRGQ